MLKQKIITAISCIAICIASTHIAAGQNVTVKFYNKTGSDVDSLIVGSTFVGQIVKDNETDFLKFPNFHFDSGHPYETLKGIVGGKSLTQLDWSWCATSHYTRTAEGTYTFDLVVVKDQDGSRYLSLENHR